MVGYLISRPDSTIAELVARDDDTELQIARAWVEQSDSGEASFGMGPLEGRILSLLGDICESTTIIHSGNWQVFDWKSVIDTLLKAQLSRSSLVDGTVRLSVAGFGVLEIEVNDGEAACRVVTGSSTIHCEALTAHRLLFGPLKPSQVVKLPAGAETLEAWCPLPLYWPTQDRV